MSCYTVRCCGIYGLGRERLAQHRVALGEFLYRREEPIVLLSRSAKKNRIRRESSRKSKHRRESKLHSRRSEPGGKARRQIPEHHLASDFRYPAGPGMGAVAGGKISRQPGQAIIPGDWS